MKIILLSDRQNWITTKTTLYKIFIYELPLIVIETT